MFVGFMVLYVIVFVICINPTFLLALWAHENARQRVKRLLNKHGGLRS